MTADPDRVTTARALLDHLGLRPADLTDPDAPARAVPTVADYLPRVEAAASPGTRRSYRSSWNRMAAALGDRRLDQVTASDIEALMRQATAGARSRRNSHHGRHAGEHLIAAARAIYRRAIADGYLTAADSPAHRYRRHRPSSWAGLQVPGMGEPGPPAAAQADPPRRTSPGTQAGSPCEVKRGLLLSVGVSAPARVEAGAVSLTVFPAILVSRFQRPGSGR
ncbi:hypothetical protein V6U89_24745 [Micromonospora sp. CPCC 206171]|uniref:hypothetical protein n=1 Tax=Micromonospora sp. CPCC 206171 TaxID=3122405 RepID=UPI002FEF59C6